MALLILFFAFIYMPLLAGLFSERSGVSQVENRFLAQIPRMELNRDSINTFPDRFEKYFSDNFGGRLAFIAGYSHLCYSIGVSPTKNVIIGKNGWLHFGDENEIKSYRKTKPFNAAQIAKWRWKMRLIKGYLEKRGVKLVFLIAPNKSSIYPEQMPDNINVVGKTGCFDQLLKVASELGIEFVDPRNDLIERKKSDEVYFRTDTHWNDLGAFVSYDLLMKSLGNRFPGLSPIPESSLGFSAVGRRGGDLFNMLGLPADNVVDMAKTANLGEILSRLKNVRAADLPKKWDSPWDLDTGNAGPRALILRDSFGNALLPLLAMHFSHIASRLDHGWFSSEIVEKEKPDVVIYEITERFLIKGPGILGNTNHLLKSLYNVTAAVESPHVSGENIMDETVPELSVRYAKSGSTPRGVIMKGPSAPLKQGEYRAVFRMKSSGKVGFPIVTIKVTAGKGRKTLGSKTLKVSDFVPDKWGNFIIDIQAGPEDETDVEFIADYLGGADLYIESSWFEKAGEKPLDIYDAPPSASAKTAALH